uniref:Uncharacterized protein n=1 Tax=Eutreptiella gymnastica TaxID=73025 RepID=A0A7S1IMS4_9EUGL
MCSARCALLELSSQRPTVCTIRVDILQLVDKVGAGGRFPDPRSGRPMRPPWDIPGMHGCAVLNVRCWFLLCLSITVAQALAQHGSGEVNHSQEKNPATHSRVCTPNVPTSPIRPWRAQQHCGHHTSEQPECAKDY